MSYKHVTYNEAIHFQVIGNLDFICSTMSSLPDKIPSRNFEIEL